MGWAKTSEDNTRAWEDRYFMRDEDVPRVTATGNLLVLTGSNLSTTANANNHKKFKK